MATTSIGGKQYPSVQEMIGTFGQMSQQVLAEEELRAKKRHQAQYGKYMAAQIKDMETRAELLKTKNQQLHEYQMGQLRARIKEQLAAERKEQAANISTVMDMVSKRREARFNNMKPGGSDTDEEVTEDYQFAWQMFDAYNVPTEVRALALSTLGPQSKPEQEITPGQKFQVISAMPKKGMDTETLQKLSDEMTKLSGIKVTPEMLQRQEELEPEQRSLMSQVVNLIADKRLDPKDVPNIMESIGKEEYGKLAADLAGVVKPERPRAMSGTEMQMMMAYATSPEQRYEIMADNRTARSGREHHAVLNTKGINEWEVVDYERAKMLKEEGLISLQHLQKFNEYWEEEEGTTTKPGKTRTSGGFEY